MLKIRKAADRGTFDHGWLQTSHSFSFADYYDPAHMGFRSLRVINDDVVAPGQGFGKHPHRDMEIVTVVLAGELEHRDSLGTGAVIHPGEVQVMTAGTGILHSEFNPSATAPVHLYQIWLLPERKGLAPRYEQREFPTAGWRRLASGSEAEGALKIHQDAELFRGTLAAGETRDYELSAGRHAWVQVLDGTLTVNGQTLTTGDGLAVSDEARLTLRAEGPADMLLFDLA